MFRVNLTARDIMTSEIITVRDKMSLEEVSEFFANQMISGAPVVDVTGRPIGVVSLSDIARNKPRRERIVSDKISSDNVLGNLDGEFEADELHNGYHLEESETLLVRDIMTPFVYRVTETTRIQELAEIMVSGRIHRLFVTRESKIVGIVSALDLLKAIVNFRE